MSFIKAQRIVDPVLTSIARGYTNAEFIAEKLFPVVKVKKESAKIPTFGKEAFRSYKSERAIAAQSNKIREFAMDTVTYETKEHDLEYHLDYRVIKESDLDQKKYATNLVVDGLKLNHEIAVAKLVQNAATFDSANKEVLTDNYLDDPETDVVAYIDEKKEALRAIIGKEPNVMVMGPKVLKALKQHPKNIERIKYSQKGILTLDLLKELFDMKNIFVGKGLYTEDDAAFKDIWGENIILAYLANPTGLASTYYEPCFGYTLRVEGNPFVDRYQTHGGKVEIVRATDNYDIKLVGKESAFLIGDVLGYEPSEE